MNKIAKKIALLSLAAYAIILIGASGIVFAQEAAAPPGGQAPASERPKSIQETFNVNEHLSTEGQNTRVPKAGDGPDAQGGLVNFLSEAIGLFVRVIASISLVIFIIGAILTITAGGKEDRLEKGKTAMVYALIGLAIALFSFMIVALVQSIFY